MVVMRVLLGPGETKVSRKGRVTSGFGSYMMNYMGGSCEVMCCSNCWLCYASWMTKVSSTYLSHRWGGCGTVIRALTSNFSINRLGMRGLIGESMSGP